MSKENKTPETSETVNEKLKLVFFIGNDVEANQSRSLAEYIKNAQLKGKLQDFKLISGSIDSIELTSLNLENTTDENTLYIVLAHSNDPEDKDGIHKIDKKGSGQFLNELRNASNHDISAILFSCYSGGVLKREEIGSGISLMVCSSNKYKILVVESQNHIFSILKYKNDNATNEQVFTMLLQEWQETMYFRNKEKDETSKFSRIGKFTLDEIEELLKDQNIGFSENQKMIFSKVLAESFLQGKKDFSIEGIRKQIAKVNSHLINILNTEKLDVEICNKFIEKLQINLQEKIAPEAIEKFIINRAKSEFKDAPEVLAEDSDSDSDSDEKIRDYASRVLLMAVRRGDIDLTHAIISQYGKEIVNKVCHETTQLMAGISKKNPKITEELVANGAEVNSIQDGRRPIAYAIEQGSEDNVRILFKAKADPDVIDDKFGFTPLITAIVSKNPRMVEIILGQNADPNLPSKDGLTPLLISIYEGAPELVKQLIAAGADVNLVSNKSTPLTIAIEENQEKIFNILIEETTTELNKSDNKGDTPLIIAIREGRKEMVSQLITKGADINLANNNGQKPIDIAKEKGYKEIVENLEKLSVQKPKVGIVKQFKNRLTAFSRKHETKNEPKPKSEIKFTQESKSHEELSQEKPHSSPKPIEIIKEESSEIVR